MRILVCGGTGLIGRALVAQLLARGHRPVVLQRRPAGLPEGCEMVCGDFASVRTAADCLPWLAGIDAVVNAVGIFHETGTQQFAQLHEHAPASLFAACAQAGVRCVVQVSALGAAPDAVTEYWRSKGRAEQVLQQSGLDWRIARPSLVLAEAGASSRFFCRLASLPLLPALEESGLVQPVLLDDLVAVLCRLLEDDQPARRSVDVVGPQALTLGDYLAGLRGLLGMSPARKLRVSGWMLNLAMAAGQYLPGSIASPDSLQMLRAGCAASAAGMTALLGSPPAPLHLQQPTALRLQSQLGWLLPLLRVVLALLWLGTAATSLWGWPRSDSYALLAATGIPAAAQPLFFYAAVALDTLFGLASLCYPRRSLWLAQGALVLGYSVIIALCLPEFLYHPFGPLLKNLPVLAVLLLLFQLDTENR